MQKQRLILPILFLLQIIGFNILSNFPEFVEKHYSNDLYPHISKFSRNVFGSIPFSIGDCIYAIVVFFVIKWAWVNRRTWKVAWKKNMIQILSFASVFYFFFHFLWALNYSRQPLFEKMSIKKEYSDQDLLVFTKRIITKTNAIHYEITKNKSLKIVFPYSQKEAFKMNLNGYKNLSKRYTYFTYSNLSIKKSLFSLPLTYMGFGGYLNPFTNEAQVNDMMPLYNFPTTTCHEMAHQMGYASESECNFIGFLASIKNDDLYFKYSGYSFALRYCLYNWEIRNPKLATQLLKTINSGIIKNYQESQDFWKQYETPIETGFKIFYDNYLKLNQQKDGLESYSKFVDLMVNYYEKREL